MQPTMKYRTPVVAVMLALALAPANAARLVDKQTPINRVVALMSELKAKIEVEGKKEQQSYDKYACWCENTLERKAKDIETAKQKIEDLSNLILKLEGEIGSMEAEIAQLKKDIAANLAAQKEATEVRDNEYADYQGDRTESEQCIGALEAAIKVLTGAGTGKKGGFLETLQEAQFVSVAAGMRRVLNRPEMNSIPEQDMQVVKHFVAKPEDFMNGHAPVLSALQLAQNPFGDYAPQSTQIQGILKGMYDAFAADLEKDNAEESDKQKAYEEFMDTKKRELEALQATLTTQELTLAEKSKLLADSKVDRDDTTEQLAADEEFFAATKKGCSLKATEWSQRSRMRTAELQGIIKAIEILSSPEASKTFTSAYTTLVQVSSVTHHTNKQGARNLAFDRLKAVASKYHNALIGLVAAQVKTNSDGHFDKVIGMIDKMIEVLRKEEAEDIAHRDRCENMENKNSNDLEDAEGGIEKANGELARMNNTEAEKKEQIDALEGELLNTKKDMSELLEMRNKEVAEFRQALKDDADAIALIEQAIVSLSKFYKDNKIPLELMQHKEPEYTVDIDKAPETSWKSGEYTGKQGEHEGLIHILEMLAEDLANEMKTAREEDAESQADYDKSMGALKESMEKQAKAKAATETSLAELQGKMADTEEKKGQLAADKEGEEELQGTLEQDCNWVKTHFESRRTKRKAEIDGLIDAKGFLAGAE